MNFMQVLISLAVVSIPFLASADPALVRSGEHANFTRLVTTLPSNATWRAEQRGRNVILQIDDLQDGFDTASVFERIPKDRIASIDGSSNMLRIGLNCDCRVAAFNAGERYAVIDIAKEDTYSGPAFIPDISASAPPNLRNRPKLSAASQEFLERPPLSTHSEAMLEEMQNRLSKELGAATTRGLLQLRKEEFLPDLQPRPLAQESKTNALAAPNMSPIANTISNIRFSNSSDPQDSDHVIGKDSLQRQPSCLTNEDIALHTWADDRPFHIQVGEARQALFEEFDQLDSVAATALAKIYLFFGFGAEARQILKLKIPLEPNHTILLSIAEIIDHGHMVHPEPILHMLDCGSEANLWALLARSEIDPTEDINPDAALRALSELPRHLRIFLAPALAGRLLRYGNKEAAAAALRSLERLPQPQPQVAALADAELEIAEGYILEATSSLAQLVADNSIQSPQALITLIETSFEKDQAISVETAELAAAFARELRDTELGLSMHRAHLLSLIATNQFDAVFEDKQYLFSTRKRAEYATIPAIAIAALTQSGEDIVFLDHALALKKQELSALEPNIILQLAKRLLALGFDEAAQNAVSLIPPRPRSKNRQLLAARIALSLQQPFKAMAELIGIEDKEAKRLKAEASHMAGAHDDANAFYRSSEDSDQAARSAWLAEDWRNDILASDPILGPIAALSLTESPQDFSPNGMLRRSADALGESESTRSALNNLLAAPAIQVLQAEDLSDVNSFGSK